MLFRGRVQRRSGNYLYKMRGCRNPVAYNKDNNKVILQRTLNIPIYATGVGLHTGRKVYLTLSPAPVNLSLIHI